jgi:hypothetical protein
MAEQYHLDVLHQGIDVWNQWRQEHHSIQPDFSGVDFKEHSWPGEPGWGTSERRGFQRRRPQGVAADQG